MALSCARVLLISLESGCSDLWTSGGLLPMGGWMGVFSRCWLTHAVWSPFLFLCCSSVVGTAVHDRDVRGGEHRQLHPPVRVSCDGTRVLGKTRVHECSSVLKSYEAHVRFEVENLRLWVKISGVHALPASRGASERGVLCPLVAGARRPCSPRLLSATFCSLPIILTDRYIQIIYKSMEYEGNLIIQHRLEYNSILFPIK